MRGRERGSTLAMSAVGLTAFMLAALLAADAGSVLIRRSEMQNLTDAAALAAAMSLEESRDAAEGSAFALAASNGTALHSGSVRFEGANRVAVSHEEPLGSLLGELLEPFQLRIQTVSRAEIRCEGTVYGLRPFGIPDQAYRLGQEIWFRNRSECDDGNRESLDLEGHSGSAFRSTIAQGARRSVSVGERVPTIRSNMTGPTRQGLEQMLSGDSTSWQAALKTPEQTRRVATLAIIALDPSESVRGSPVAKIREFAQFYVVAVDSEGDFRGRFIRRVSPRVAGTGSTYSVRLVQ